MDLLGFLTCRCRHNGGGPVQRPRLKASRNAGLLDTDSALALMSSGS